MGPVPNTPKKECYTVLILHFFRETLIQAREPSSLCKRQKLGPNRGGSDAWEKSLRARHLREGIQRSEREDQNWFNAYLKSTAFVNLDLVINGPSEFAKHHQAQTY